MNLLRKPKHCSVHAIDYLVSFSKINICLLISMLKISIIKVLPKIAKSDRRVSYTLIREMSSLGEGKNLIAITQMCATSDKTNNMHQVESLFKKAKEQNVKFIFFPESCDFIAENSQQLLEMAEPLTGYTMQQYQALAKEYKLWTSLGSVHESILDQCEQKTDKIYNSHVILNDCGEIVAVYRKMHLFDVDTSEISLRESKKVTGGHHLVKPVETPIGKLGLQICYDVRFPEASILLRKAGADILLYPSVFTYVTGEAHWEILQRARAIENQCFVLSAAQVGYHNPKRHSWGHAMAINPWGKILANLGDQKLDIAVVEIDLNISKSIRCNMPCFDHRRNDIYSLTFDGDGTTECKEDQLFAKCIIKKETIFFESSHSFAFTNLRCVVTGHVLVSSKRIVPRVKDLNAIEKNDLFSTVCYIQRMLDKFYETTSATVTVQDGCDAGQTVPHVHFHVMPRRPNDFLIKDQIYTKLEDKTVCLTDRTLEERIQEAQQYRKMLCVYENL